MMALVGALVAVIMWSLAALAMVIVALGMIVRFGLAVVLAKLFDRRGGGESGDDVP